MLCLQGKGVARGYAIGRAVVLGAAALEVAHYRVSEDEVTREVDRLQQALVQAQDQLQHLADQRPRRQQQPR